MMKRALILMAALLVFVVPVYGGLFTPKAPPGLIINNNTNLTVNYITTNEGGYFAGDVVIDGNLVAINITVLGNINNVTIININVTNDMVLYGDLTVYGIITGENATFSLLNVTDTITAETIISGEYLYSNGESMEDRYLLLNTSNGPLINNLTIDAPGDVELRLLSDSNRHSYLYFMESSINGFRLWYDGSGTNIFKFDAIDAGVVVPRMWFNRDTEDIDFFGNIDMNEHNMSNIQCLELNGSEICGWASINGTTGVGTGKKGDDIYLYNDSDTMYLNETKLNDTIDLRVDIGINFLTSLSSTNILGSDLSGNSGETNRNYSSNASIVSVDNSFLHPVIDYTTPTGYVVFLNPIWDDMFITLWETELISNFTYINYVGSDLSGNTGEVDRGLVITDVTMVVVDNQFLHPVNDYTEYETNITFINSVWDDMDITVWRS